MRLKGRRRVVRAASVPAPKPAAPPTLPLEQAWSEAVRLFANRRGMRVRANWTFGIAERLLPDRFARLTGRPAAKRATHLLRQLSNADLRVFHARAAIGQEQAVVAARLTLVVNVSAPIGLVVFVASLLPPSVQSSFWSTPFAAGVLASVIAAVSLLVLLVVWYAFAGVQQARDLHHLALLEMARRGLAPTIGGGEHDPTGGRP